MAKKVRHEATSHYHLAPARQNLEYLGASPKCSMNFHEMSGNNFFPIGEEVMFAAGLKKHYPEGDVCFSRRLNVWLDWNEAASDWAIDLHAEIYKAVILENFPDKELKLKEVQLPRSA